MGEPLKRLSLKPVIPVAGNDQLSQRGPETKYTSFQPSHSKGFGLGLFSQRFGKPTIKVRSAPLLKPGFYAILRS